MDQILIEIMLYSDVFITTQTLSDIEGGLEEEGSALVVLLVALTLHRL